MTELGAGSSEPPTRLLIVDDNQLFRECLVAVLDDDAGLEVVGSTGEINRAVEFLETSKPQIVLIDVQLTDQSALRLATEISAKHPQIKALIIGLEESEADILRCIEAGASGYVLKEASLDDLRESISTLMHGGAPCSPRIAYQAFSRLAELSGQTWTRSDVPELSVREIEILGLVSRNLSNKEIADELFISLYTVKNHIHHILEKLKVKNRRQAVTLARERRLLGRAS